MSTLIDQSPCGIKTIGGEDRLEIKYSVPERAALETVQWAGCFLPRDRGNAGPQMITSLYLDTPQMAFYRWHEERRPDRFKLRVRKYGDGGRTAWLEIKRKTDGIGRKERTEVPADVLDSLLRSTGSSDTTCNAFLQERLMRQAEPIMLVKSSRDAFRDRTAMGEVAVTIDHEVMYQSTTRYDMVAAAAGWQRLELPSTSTAANAIVELKFHKQPPAWMATLMEGLAAFRVGFSKYHAAIKQSMASER